MMLSQPSTPQWGRVIFWPTLCARFPALWRESHRQAAQDIRARWRRCGMWCLVVMWLLALVFILIALALADAGPKYDFGACLPDGSFSIKPDTYRYFSGSGFFEITLAFGKMSFTQVKAIDVMWDVLVGRGGQAAIVYVSWRIFANYVTTSMEVMPVTFRTYRTIFLDNGSLLIGIPRLIRDFCSRHALHSRVAMVFMVFTMAFSLAFPTLLSSLTGYKANVDAFVKTADDNYTPFSSFDFAYYIIHDGWRVGFEKDHVISISGTSGGTSEPILGGGYTHYGSCFWTASSWDSHESCYLILRVADYVNNHSTDRLSNVTSTFMGQELPPPVLNISSFNVPVVNISLLSNDTDSEVSSVYINSVTLPEGKATMWAYENATYSEDDLIQNGKCQPTLDYQWGVSFIQTFITVILLLIWSIGIYIMWLHSHSVMKRRGRNDVAGEYKAILELAHAMQEQHAGLEAPTKEQQEYGLSTSISVTEAMLRRRVSKELRGGSIAYAAPLLANGETTDTWTLQAWIKDHKWSISGMFLSLLLAFLSPVLIPTGIMFLPALPILLAGALYVGSTRGSRVVIFCWPFLLCVIVLQCTLYTTMA